MSPLERYLLAVDAAVRAGEIMGGDRAKAMGDVELEKDRARYGLLAVVVSNLAIAGVAIFGVWRLDGDKSVIVGVLTAAFTAVSSMTTAYLGIKAVSNTAKAMAQERTARAQTTQSAPVSPAPASAPHVPAPAPGPAASPAPASPKPGDD
ncbi:hypothetical protein ABZ876_04265 [Streptomyces sp. NPDC046931]|uniref:hypothetical protein n=1 Tax=Streptomyces sp. NPDC046931 TaxID=3154806 RepID=UPI0033E240F7